MEQKGVLTRSAERTDSSKARVESREGLREPRVGFDPEDPGPPPLGDAGRVAPTLWASVS